MKRFKDSNLDFHYDGDLNQVFEWFESHNTELLQKIEEKFNIYLAKFSIDRPPEPAHIRKYLLDEIISLINLTNK